jgi:DNA invertase Pin-like site-specific DNA recombinase
MRTREALKAIKRKGIKLGRPPGKGKSKLDKYGDEIVALLKNGSTQKYIADKYKCHESTLCNWLKKNGYNRQELINGN